MPSSPRAHAARAGSPTRRKFNLFDIANPYILTKWQSERDRHALRRERAAGGRREPGLPVRPGRHRAHAHRRHHPRAARQAGARATGRAASAPSTSTTAPRAISSPRRRAASASATSSATTTSRSKDFFELVCKVGRHPRAAAADARARSPPASRSGMELWADHVSHKEPPATYRSMRYAQRSAFFSNAKAKRELGLPTRPLEETRAPRGGVVSRGDFAEVRRRDRPDDAHRRIRRMGLSIETASADSALLRRRLLLRRGLLGAVFLAVCGLLRASPPSSPRSSSCLRQCFLRCLGFGLAAFSSRRPSSCAPWRRLLRRRAFLAGAFFARRVRDLAAAFVVRAHAASPRRPCR